MVATRKRNTKRAASPDDVEPKKRGRNAKSEPPPMDNASNDIEETLDDDDEPVFKTNSKYESSKTQVAEGQYAKAQNLIIPVDEVCPLAHSFHVYVDHDDGIIYGTCNGRDDIVSLGEAYNCPAGLLRVSVLRTRAFIPSVDLRLTCSPRRQPQPDQFWKQQQQILPHPTAHGSNG